MNIGNSAPKLRFLVAVHLAFSLGATTAIAQGDRVPVMVGGDENLDACGGIGVVANLKPVAGNALSVRAGPGLQYASLDKLAAGTRLWLCDGRDGWLGVVYGSTDCGVSTPVPDRRTYAGPCSSGWVYRKYVDLIAG